MTNLQGALGVAQMEELPEFIERKQKNYPFTGIIAGTVKPDICCHSVREPSPTNGSIPMS